MLGVYDFCGHYEWTFQWLEQEGGGELLKRYWEEAIAHDSQAHARELITREGIAGMERYWGHTLAEESPERGYFMESNGERLRIDMHDCPSKGFLLRNGLEQCRDYCNHCIGWIAPIMEEAGFAVEHEHNHRGQCWWEFSPRSETAEEATGPLPAPHDIRATPEWEKGPVESFLPEPPEEP